MCLAVRHMHMLANRQRFRYLPHHRISAPLGAIRGQQLTSRVFTEYLLLEAVAKPFFPSKTK